MYKLTPNQSKLITSAITSALKDNQNSAARNYAVQKVAPTLKAFNGKRVTIYRNTSFGIAKTECLLACTGTCNYAQFAAVPFAIFIEKGKRSLTKISSSDYPTFYIVDGWNAPEFENYNVIRTANGVTTKRGRYLSCDPRWASDLASFIETSPSTLISQT